MVLEREHIVKDLIQGATQEVNVRASYVLF